MRPGLSALREGCGLRGEPGEFARKVKVARGFDPFGAKPVLISGWRVAEQNLVAQCYMETSGLSRISAISVSLSSLPTAWPASLGRWPYKAGW